jgi:hypothetical protein
MGGPFFANFRLNLAGITDRDRPVTDGWQSYARQKTPHFPGFGFRSAKIFIFFAAN